MAIFGNHIKGTSNATSADNSVSSGLGTGIGGSDAQYAAQSKDISLSPVIRVADHNGSYPVNEDISSNLGHILTDQADNTHIKSAGFFDKATYYQYDKSEDIGGKQGSSRIGFFQGGPDCNDGLLQPYDQDNVSALAIDSYCPITIRFFKEAPLFAPTHASDLAVAAIYQYVFQPKTNPDDPKEPDPSYLDYKTGARTNIYANLGVQDQIECDNGIKCDEYVQALYFNATSDKRAKDNIHPLLTNALDIIKNVNVYTFNFKSKPEERMIGVIAQEFLDKRLDGVSLVENEAATGENEDYMSIRESKLVYLLLKGMQEQQAQIEQLQRRISELESK